jgi:hypothetical protein
MHCDAAYPLSGRTPILDRRRAELVLSTLAVWLLAASPAAAAPTLTAIGLRGGSTFDIGELNTDKPTTHEEITFTIGAGTATQYRLVQSVSRPLTNDRGTVLEPGWIRLELFGAKTGTIRIRGVVALSPQPTELFVSAISGQNEQLTMLMSASLRGRPNDPIGTEAPEAGTYTGAFHYILQSINGAAVKTLTVPIRLRVNPVTSLNLSPDSRSRISFGRLDPGQESSPTTIRVMAANNLSGDTRLEQQLTGPLRNEAGDALPLRAISITPLSAGAVSSTLPLEPRMTLLASVQPSRPIQAIELAYRLAIPESQPAGTYRGIVSLRLGGSQGQAAATMDVPIEVTVNSVLSLRVTNPAGGEPQLDFGQIDMGRASPVRSLAIKIQSNTKSRYRVLFHLEHPLANQHAQLPADSLLCAPSRTLGGRLESPMLPVPVDRQVPLYVSDAGGSTASFFQNCRTFVPNIARAGEYRTRIIYELSTP